MKLLAFDLDGTTLKKHIELTQANQQALLELYEQGVVLVPATGRIVNFIPECISQLKGVRYFITSNGASVYDRQEEKQIYSNLIPSAKAWEVVSVLKDYEVYVEFYANGKAKLEKRFQKPDFTGFAIPAEHQIFFTKQYEMIDSYQQVLTEEQLCPEKINLPFVPTEMYDSIWQTLTQIKGIDLTSSIRNNIEINAAGCNKGDALQFLCEHLGILPQDVMSIGDNGNDVEMLEFAGISVAMGNATEAARRAAKHQTESCNEDGFAKAVARFL